MLRVASRMAAFARQHYPADGGMRQILTALPCVAGPVRQRLKGYFTCCFIETAKAVAPLGCFVRRGAPRALHGEKSKSGPDFFRCCIARKQAAIKLLHLFLARWRSREIRPC